MYTSASSCQLQRITAFLVPAQVTARPSVFAWPDFTSIAHLIVT